MSEKRENINETLGGGAPGTAGIRSPQDLCRAGWNLSTEEAVNFQNLGSVVDR